jgi:hypothetical protein
MVRSKIVCRPVHISWPIRGLPTPIQVLDPYTRYVRQVQDPEASPAQSERTHELTTREALSYCSCGAMIDDGHDCNE